MDTILSLDLNESLLQIDCIDTDNTKWAFVVVSWIWRIKLSVVVHRDVYNIIKYLTLPHQYIWSRDNSYKYFDKYILIGIVLFTS